MKHLKLSMDVHEYKEFQDILKEAATDVSLLNIFPVTAIVLMELLEKHSNTLFYQNKKYKVKIKLSEAMAMYVALKQCITSTFLSRRLFAEIDKMLLNIEALKQVRNEIINS